MPSLIQLKKRIRSVGNITKITKAMEMVSAAKMRQAQTQALRSRVYSRKLDEMLTKIARDTDTSLHPLLETKSDTSNQAVLIVSTDRGLTGSLNAHLFHAFDEFQTEHDADCYTIGRLAKEYTIKAGHNLVAEFGSVGEKINYEVTQPVSDLLIRQYLDGKYQKIWLLYMDFISTLHQEPRLTQLLPIEYPQVDTEIKAEPYKEYTFEPSPGAILNNLLPYFIEVKVYQALLEARASEHSARMVAMKNASDNAKEVKDSLTLEYNSSRQSHITNELADIVTASLSLPS